MREPRFEGGFFDVRTKHRVYHGSANLKGWDRVKGIVLHQTACRIGDKVERWYPVTCHFGITPGGKAILNNDLNRTMYHANGLNGTTVGIEIDGNYYGIDGKENTFWAAGGGPHHLTQEQIDAAKDAIRFIVREVESNGGKIEAVFAHRQSSNQRQGDPGSEIWKQIGLWAQDEGLNNNPGFTVGSGMPLPVDWDHRSVWNWNGVIDRDGGKRIQAVLNYHDYAVPPLVVDGIMGPKTKAAIKALQSDKGLVPDGIFGPKTWEAWYSLTVQEERSFIDLVFDWLSEAADRIATIDEIKKESE